MDENSFKKLETEVSNIGTKQDGLKKEVSNMSTGLKKDLKDLCASFISRLDQLINNEGMECVDASNIVNSNVQNIDTADTDEMGSNEMHKSFGNGPSSVIDFKFQDACYPTDFFDIFKEVEDTGISRTKVSDLSIFHISDYFYIFEEKSDKEKSCLVIPPLQASSKFEIQFSGTISDWTCLQIYLQVLSYLKKVVGDQYAGRYRGRLGTAFPINLLCQVSILEEKIYL